MCVVSGDSDIQPVVEWVCKNYPKIKIYVYIPALPNLQRDRRIDYYLTQRLQVECKFLPLDTIKDHQMKATVKLGGGKLAVRPYVWEKDPINLSRSALEPDR